MNELDFYDYDEWEARDNGVLPFGLPFVVLPVIGVVSVIGAGALAYRNYKKQHPPAPSGGVLAKYQAVPGVEGVYTKSGVVLNSTMTSYLPKLRAKVAELAKARGLPDFDIVITSGYRSASSQYDAMLNNCMGRGGPGACDGYLRGLYGSNIEYIIPHMGSKAAAVAALEAHPVSNHQAASAADADALDLSLWTPQGDILSGGNSGHHSATEQQGVLLDAGKATAYNAIHEGNHVHVGKLTRWSALTGGSSEGEGFFGNLVIRAKAAGPFLAVGSALVGAALIGGVLYYTRDMD